ncbi:MAG: hypothetical protein NVS4B9_39190 [Ktedonobacteraceae bacterium]
MTTMITGLALLVGIVGIVVIILLVLGVGSWTRTQDQGNKHWNAPNEDAYDEDE